MKLTELLVAVWCSLIVARSETSDGDQEALLRRAAEQLERLAPYRRMTGDNRGESDLTELLKSWRSQSVERNHLDETRTNEAEPEEEEEVPWEVLEILPEQTEADATKRIDGDKMITIGVLADPKYTALMQERIKRGFDSGTASLLTSIAGGVLSGVASASSSSAGKALASSSQTAYKPTYGAPVEHAYSYEEKPFGPWDFKKAIFGTLFQAIKAIGGGVLALKGQLVKGGGYLLAGKGKVVSKAGDVITSFGKHLAASAVTEPKPYPPESYYDHPPIQNTGHDHGYQGPPPSNDYSEANDYSPHETYGVPSDDNNQGGLLIVMPTKSDLDGHDDGQRASVVAVQEHPDPTKLEGSFGGLVKRPVIANLLSSVPIGSVGTKDQIVVNQDSNNNNVEPYPPTQHPVPVYGAPDHYSANNHHDNSITSQDYGNSVQNPAQTYEQNYHAVQNNIYQQPELPQTTSSHHQFPYLNDPGLEYSSQRFPYLANVDPHIGASPLNLPKLPYNNDDGGTSVYASLSVDTEPQIAPYKVSLLEHKPNDLDPPKLQPHLDFHGQRQFGNYLHGSLGGPLRIPLLNPMPTAYYWHNQGSVMPTSPLVDNLGYYRKADALQRRTFAKRLALYSPVPRTRFHRL